MSVDFCYKFIISFRFRIVLIKFKLLSQRIYGLWMSRLCHGDMSRFGNMLVTGAKLLFYIHISLLTCHLWISELKKNEEEKFRWSLWHYYLQQPITNCGSLKIIVLLWKFYYQKNYLKLFIGIFYSNRHYEIAIVSFSDVPMTEAVRHPHNSESVSQD